MVKEVLADYELLWNQAGVLTKEKLDAYKKSYDRYKEFKKENISLN